MSSGPIVLDASALVDLLSDAPGAAWIAEQVHGRAMVAPAHMLAEVLSAVGRRTRQGLVRADDAEAAIRRIAAIDVASHALDDLLLGAWARRERHSLADALYVELAAQLDTVVITTDRRLARATPLAVAPPD